jgi:3-oxoacyl-[acyl-carrier-protein] synthase-3
MLHKTKIVGIGSYVPEKVLTNYDLEKMVDTSDEWISTRTGMKERRIAKNDEFTSDMGIQAALRALNHAKISAQEIDYILFATTTPDYVFPSTACLVQQAIGAKNACALDIQAACSGYLYGLSIAKSFVESGAYKNVLVIASEKLSSITNYKDRSTCILFGDGAAACVVSQHTEAPGFLLKSIFLGADGQHANLGMMPAGGCRLRPSYQTIDAGQHYIHMSGNEVFKHAVRNMEYSCKECLALAQLRENDISWLIPHQANKRIIEAIAKRFEHLSTERIYNTIHKYGNTSASSIGITLDELMQNASLKSDEHILLTAFGFGFTWGAAVLTYQER